MIEMEKEAEYVVMGYQTRQKAMHLYHFLVDSYISLYNYYNVMMAYAIAMYSIVCNTRGICHMWLMLYLYRISYVHVYSRSHIYMGPPI